MTEAATSSPLSSVARRPRHVRLGVTILAVAVLLAASGIVYWRWHNGAKDLSPYFPANDTVSHWHVDRVLYVGSEIAPRTPYKRYRRVDLHQVAPRITLNTAHADVALLTCRVRDPHFGFGDERNPSSVCATVHAFRPGPVDLGFGTTEIVYRLTFHQPGVLRVSGADVTYSAGSRRGDQHAGLGFVIHVIPATR